MSKVDKGSLHITIYMVRKHQVKWCCQLPLSLLVVSKLTQIWVKCGLLISGLGLFVFSCTFGAIWKVCIAEALNLWLLPLKWQPQLKLLPSYKEQLPQSQRYPQKEKRSEGVKSCAGNIQPVSWKYWWHLIWINFSKGTQSIDVECKDSRENCVK